MSILSTDLETLSHEAYVYLYPLVMMGITHRQATNLAQGVRPGFGPANQFHHLRTFPPADYRAVVRVNFDTLYSSAWLDLTAGPLIVHTPDTADRYYMLPMLDMWTDVFATLGKRTTGTAARDFVVVGPEYAGDVPAGMSVINAPTPYVWVIGRTQTNGPADYAVVNAIQDGYTITELVPVPTPAPDPSIDTTTEALTLVNRMSAVEFLAFAAELLKVIPPHATDYSVLARIANMGIVAGRPFDASRFTAEQIAQIETGAGAALAGIVAAAPKLGRRANGWSMHTDTMGVYGNFYLKRAVITLIGLGANPAEDAVYPFLDADADGEPLIGENDYVLHFEADELPPAFAFWSVTMYDADGFQVHNEIDRFALGDRDPLVYNPDGSLDLYLQRANPGPGLEANWLPSQAGPLGVTMRLYAPEPEVLDGRWTPPAVRRRM